MAGLLHLFGERPTAPAPSGPGDYVKAKYDQAVGSIAGAGVSTGFSLLSSGFGKGLLAVAIGAMALGALSFGLAAASGALPVIGGLGIVTNATVAQGIMIGIGEGLGWLASAGGITSLIAGGLAGAAVESKRHPPEMNVADAQALALKYKESRERGIELEIAAPEKQQVTEKQQAAEAPAQLVTDKAEDEKTTTVSYAARETQRRSQAAGKQCEVA